jgi:hypothetical protein
MTDNTLCNVKHKSSLSNLEYCPCDICEFNGYPNEKIVFVIHGFRPENEDGFAIKFTQYDYPIQKGNIHRHKFNEDIAKTLVNRSLGRSWA